MIEHVQGQVSRRLYRMKYHHDDLSRAELLEWITQLEADLEGMESAVHEDCVPVEDYDDLDRESDSLKDQRDELEAERDDLQNERDDLNRTLDAVIAERDELLKK